MHQKRDIGGLDTAHQRAPVAQWLIECPDQEFNKFLPGAQNCFLCFRVIKLSLFFMKN